MEMMHQSYSDIMVMPYPLFIDMLKWKSNLEKEKKKMIDEKNSKIETMQRRKHASESHRAKQLSRRR